MMDRHKVTDDLARISSLVQVIFMAANDLHDRKQLDAIQAVCDIADDAIEGLIEHLRDGGDEQ